MEEISKRVQDTVMSEFPTFCPPNTHFAFLRYGKFIFLAGQRLVGFDCSRKMEIPFVREGQI